MTDRITSPAGKQRRLAIAETWQMPDRTWRRGPFIEYTEADLRELKHHSDVDSSQLHDHVGQCKAESIRLPQA
jgi:hypothetical protein